MYTRILPIVETFFLIFKYYYNIENHTNVYTPAKLIEVFRVEPTAKF